MMNLSLASTLLGKIYIVHLMTILFINQNQSQKDRLQKYLIEKTKLIKGLKSKKEEAKVSVLLNKQVLKKI